MAVQKDLRPAKVSETPRLRGAKLALTVGAGLRLAPLPSQRFAPGSKSTESRAEGSVIPPDKRRELEQYRWLRDHAEEAAKTFRPGDTRRDRPDLLRSGAEKMIHLIETGAIPGRRKR